VAHIPNLLGAFCRAVQQQYDQWLSATEPSTSKLPQDGVAMSRLDHFKRSISKRKNNLIGGFNTFGKYSSKWESSPNRGEHKKI